MSNEIHRQNTLEVATIENNGVVAVAQQTKLELGEPRDNTVLVFIRNTYPARYNHAVRNMNSLNPDMNTKKKHSMRGGHFFLYRYIILLAILLSFGFGIASLYVKACSAVPFVLTVLYIALTIYNIVIYFKNRPLLHPDFTRKVPRGQLNGMINRFFKIPVNATVLTGAIAAFVNPATIAAVVRRDNIQLTEIDFMLYDDRYLSRSGFPKEIVIHMIIFIILFILAIAFVGTTISK